MSNPKVIKVSYHKGSDKFTYHSDDPSVIGDEHNPSILFRSEGKMEFRCDNSDGIKLRFHKSDPCDWEPDPPRDEGYYELVDNQSCLIFHNHHCHMGATKLTLKLECKLDGDWKRKDSDPIIVNMPPT
jgi:hypothetical protein